MPYKYNPITGKMDYYEPAGAEGGETVTLEAFRLTGRYYSSVPFNVSISSYSGYSEKLYALPFLVPVAQSFDRIGINLVSGDAGAVGRLGIYSDSDVYPSSLVYASSSNLDFSFSGIKEESIDISLEPGLFFFFFLFQSGSTLQFKGASSDGFYGILGAQSPGLKSYINYEVNQAFGSLPDPYPTGALLKNSGIFLIYLRKA